MVNSTKTEKVISKGKKCCIRIGNNIKDAQIIGFVQEYSVIQVIQILEASVIGNMGNITHDANEIMCKIYLESFLPKRDLISDINKISLSEVFTNLSDKGYNGVINGVSSYFDFYDEKNNKVYDSYFNVSVYVDGKFLIGSSIKT
jgi:hypothetical protein